MVLLNRDLSSDWSIGQDALLLECPKQFDFILALFDLEQLEHLCFSKFFFCGQSLDM